MQSCGVIGPFGIVPESRIGRAELGMRKNLGFDKCEKFSGGFGNWVEFCESFDFWSGLSDLGFEFGFGAKIFGCRDRTSVIFGGWIGMAGTEDVPIILDELDDRYTLK